jgi:Flp pilus assembly protein TadD
VGSQFGLVLPFAVWGWMKLPSARWQIFFVVVILFDLVYGVFLNIISSKITPFGLSSCVLLAILIGVGIAHILKVVRQLPFVGKMTFRAINVAVCLMPAIPLTFNYDLCDQSRNYTAYEHALNIFRTVDNGATLFLDGDNNIFPVTYGRMVERMREDIRLYDRPNLFFRMPYIDECKENSFTAWEELRPMVEKRIIEEPHNGIYYAVFNPFPISVPDGFALHPYGILHKMTQDATLSSQDAGQSVWPLYVTESLLDDFRKDFMTREVAAYFHFARGKYFFMTGQPDQGLKSIQWASRVGYDGTDIHSDMAVFLTDHGFFEQARCEREKALIYYEDLSGVYNNWGYYYHKLGDYDKAAESFRKAIDLRPDNHGYYNNLGLALYHCGRKDEANLAFQRSLAMDGNQSDLSRFLKEPGLMHNEVE